MSRVWRLLLDGAGSGPWNMGVDEALLAAAARGGPPTLRFYAWRGSWLSLGYAQTLSTARGAACARAGVGIVRRVTGGRAVLHGGDLTYAVAAPAGLLPRGLQASYGLVSDALCEALRSRGVAAVRASAVSSPSWGAPRFDCFAEAAAEEICVAGRKLVGSAQRRSGGAVLQHGSIRVRPDPCVAARAAGQVSGAATSLRELGVSTSDAALREVCAACLGAALGASFESGHLAEGERRQAREAARQRDPGFSPHGAESPRESQGDLSATDR
ncbi:MAG: hypothetical protein OEM49_04840 [Myxococcales bacterium]|nr:hypothetical protein [Myxococcales bacterium]